ncbi:MAG: acetyl-CoA carboxylase biotin carboxylase subunit [Bacteriovoracales bacterium]|nr:acetyl-CoA carboxylase biotin carboxylase subunit [Bacteriovoracales bacterium]
MKALLNTIRFFLKSGNKVKIKKVLIANRGEIALRILRTCKEMGIETVSVHSTADEESLHVKLADESVCIGPPRSAKSYLNIPALLSAAEITNADSIHPGFGFLSENFEFASSCKQWGLTFIGPNMDCIKKMGSKIQAKEMAKKANIPILESLSVNGLSDKEVTQAVGEMTLPVLIKASAGGGGRGMCRVDKIEDLIPQIRRLEEEAKAAFGDDTLFIEKYITSPRHIEVQILADQHGNMVHLGERDCTVQRRFQKILEESPSPILDEKIRNQICNSAVRLAQYVGYDSVGTVEYLFDQNTRKFYFMEMNTRIQVEHPVTEQRIGLDLIAEQIKVAEGRPLDLKQSDIQFNGHCIECRINAENPKTFAPSPGQIIHYYRPGGIGIRVDDFIYSGYMVSPYYDSMVAKIISHAPTRSKCIERMKRALKETIIDGIHHNISLHLKILSDTNFKGNNYSTNLLDQILR